MKELKELKPKWYSHTRIVDTYLYRSLIKTRQYVRGALLDVGCGTKPYEIIIGPVVTKYIGLDLPPDISANKAPKKADVYCDVSINLPIRDETFDTVLCTEVLEHLPESNILIREISRVLKKGGHLILTSPQTWGLHEVSHNYYRFTEFGLGYLLEKNGLRLFLLENRGGFWAMIGQRISSFIHYTFVEKKNIFYELIFKLIYILLSEVFLVLDKVCNHKGDTLGNTVVARKI